MTDNRYELHNIDLSTVMSMAPHISMDDIDKMCDGVNIEFEEACEECKRDIQKICDDARRELEEDEEDRKAVKRIVDRVKHEVKNFGERWHDYAGNVIDMSNSPNLVASLLLSLSEYGYLVGIEKYYDYSKHSKLANILRTGATNKDKFKLISKFFKVYSILNATSVLGVLIVKAIRKHNKK